MFQLSRQQSRHEPWEQGQARWPEGATVDAGDLVDSNAIAGVLAIQETWTF